MSGQRVVVCAAVRGEGHMVCGPRHLDATMRTQIDFLIEKYENLKPLRWDQGFVDQHGKFMTRREALQVAESAGQLNVRRPKTTPLHLLFSEDLY